MASASRLTGTPWHVERMSREEDDEKRHRSRCRYFEGRCSENCSYYKERCHGAAHCEVYAEKGGASLPDKNGTGRAVPFTGIKEIPVDEIEFVPDIKDITASMEKIDEVTAYFMNHGELDRPVTVAVQNGKYIVTGNHLRMYAVNVLGLQLVPAEMGTEEEIRNRELLRKTGTMVWDKRESQFGEVISSTLRTTTVEFYGKKLKTYDICRCLETKNISFI